MTAGTDGRICHYHWRPASAQPDPHSSQSKTTHPSLTPEHTLPVADHGSLATSRCHSPSAAIERGGSEGSKGQSKGESNGQSNGHSGRQARDEERGVSSGQDMSLVCVAEERLPNITTVQDIVEIVGGKEQLVCGFQVLLLLLLLLLILCHRNMLVGWGQVLAKCIQ